MVVHPCPFASWVSKPVAGIDTMGG